MLLGEDGTAVTTVCPGGTYTLQASCNSQLQAATKLSHTPSVVADTTPPSLHPQVTYSGEAREALLTSSAGATINSNASAACLNRLTAAPANRTTRATLRLDCTATLPGVAD